MNRIVVGIALLLGSAAADPAADQEEARARGFDGEIHTDRVTMYWRTSEASADQIAPVLATADALAEKLQTTVGYPPKQPTTVVLAGHGLSGERRRFPNVDENGRVIMFRFRDAVASYADELAHELVHAYRRHTGEWTTGFWEEGYAEAIAMLIEPDDIGFPRYGYPLTVAAGHLLERDEWISLVTIRDRHDDIGRQCQLQAYLERASFFHYLTQTYGVARLNALIYGDGDVDASFETFYAMDFETAVTNWQDALRKAYDDHPDANAIADRYRAEPPIRGRRICRPSDHR